jgi:GTPase involved in cell partitioning and DNA repair
MSIFEKVKKSVSEVVDDFSSQARPDFIKDVQVVQVELEKYQTLLSNVEQCFSEGEIDKEDYDSLKLDHESKITALKAKIMSWSREYLELKNGITNDLDLLTKEKKDAEASLEKIEKHFSLHLITEEEYDTKKNNFSAIIKRTSAAIEKKQKFYDEIIIISPYIEE